MAASRKEKEQIHSLALCFREYLKEKGYWENRIDVRADSFGLHATIKGDIRNGDFTTAFFEDGVWNVRLSYLDLDNKEIVGEFKKHFDTVSVHYGVIRPANFVGLTCLMR